MAKIFGAIVVIILTANQGFAVEKASEQVQVIVRHIKVRSTHTALAKPIENLAKFLGLQKRFGYFPKDAKVIGSAGSEGLITYPVGVALEDSIGLDASDEITVNKKELAKAALLKKFLIMVRYHEAEEWNELVKHPEEIVVLGYSGQDILFAVPEDKEAEFYRQLRPLNQSIYGKYLTGQITGHGNCARPLAED